MDKKPLILVVDDEPANVMLLEAYLVPQGYEVIKAMNGEEALRAVDRNPPDLVLLDVMMPGLDGFEVTRRLKNAPLTKLTPVVLVTSLKDTSDRIKGLEAGCDDFMSKPFDKNELMARVKTSLRIKHLQDQIQQDYKQLQELERMKNSLTHMIVHDLNNPLTVVSLKLEMIAMRGESTFTSEQKNDVNVASSSVRELTRMISDLLDINKMEEGKIKLRQEEFDLNGLITGVFREMSVISESENKKINFISQPLPAVLGDKELIRRVVVNLVNNAIKFTPSAGHIDIKSEFNETEKTFYVSVQDSGTGIPEEYLTKIFDKFVQVESANAKKGRGLGLTFCKLAIEAHGGKIWAQSPQGSGAIFTFTLPGTGHG